MNIFFKPSDTKKSHTLQRKYLKGFDVKLWLYSIHGCSKDKISISKLSISKCHYNLSDGYGPDKNMSCEGSISEIEKKGIKVISSFIHQKPKYGVPLCVDLAKYMVLQEIRGRYSRDWVLLWCEEANNIQSSNRNIKFMSKISAETKQKIINDTNWPKKIDTCDAQNLYLSIIKRTMDGFCHNPDMKVSCVEFKSEKLITSDRPLIPLIIKNNKLKFASPGCKNIMIGLPISKTKYIFVHNGDVKIKRLVKKDLPRMLNKIMVKNAYAEAYASEKNATLDKLCKKKIFGDIIHTEKLM